MHVSLSSHPASPLPLNDQPSTAYTVNSIRWIMISLGIVAIAATLLLTRLGNHALWDDEAYTALTAEGIERTGDTSVLLDHNIFAWSNGSTLRGLHDRFFPPLPAYLAAASMRVLGNTAMAARLPFALCGILLFCVILRWLWVDRVDGWTGGIFLLLLLINVSLILFCRQCRYYAVSIFLCVLIAELYVHHLRSLFGQILLTLSLTALFATQYFCFGAVLVCGVIDYATWGRRISPITWRRGIGFAVLLGLLIGLHLLVWSPFGPHAVVLNALPGTLLDDLRRLWWNVRDTHVNEFWNLALLTLAPLIAWQKTDVPLRRGCVAFITYFLLVTAISPHGSGRIGEVRYFCALIPLACFLEARTLRQLFSVRPVNAFLIAIALFSTNLFSFGPFTALGSFPIPIRSTIVSYASELTHPPLDSYRVVSDWMNSHALTDRSVLVLPEYATYPLMFHAPAQVYAWQLADQPTPQFYKMPSINFRDRELPDYIIVFGAQGQAQFDHLGSRTKRYSVEKTLPIFAKDAYRPELFLRIFGDLPRPEPPQSVHILRLRTANIQTHIR